MNFRVVKALILKYGYICSRNTFRALDIFFWPVMDLLVWGFVSVYMMKSTNALPALVTFLIAAAILWNVMFRAQQVVSVSFLDDVWSRNLLNIWAAPIRPIEYVGAAYIMGLAQAVIVLVLVGGLAIPFYSFNIFSLGVGFAFLFVNLLMMGWSMGLLVTGFILRWGPPAEALAWAVPFIVQPVSAVFYPISVLPPWLQPVAYAVPAAHVFEGMRQLIQHGQIAPVHIWCAVGLNLLYMFFSACMFKFCFEQARRRGFLAKYAA
ncbi:MAG TPA: ABC transporter permease [Candidatus Obscuribacterales bacterium]